MQRGSNDRPLRDMDIKNLSPTFAKTYSSHVAPDDLQLFFKRAREISSELWMA